MRQAARQSRKKTCGPGPKPADLSQELSETAPARHRFSTGDFRGRIRGRRSHCAVGAAPGARAGFTPEIRGVSGGRRSRRVVGPRRLGGRAVWGGRAWHQRGKSRAYREGVGRAAPLGARRLGGRAWHQTGRNSRFEGVFEVAGVKPVPLGPAPEIRGRIRGRRREARAVGGPRPKFEGRQSRRAVWVAPGLTPEIRSAFNVAGRAAPLGRAGLQRANFEVHARSPFASRLWARNSRADPKARRDPFSWPTISAIAPGPMAPGPAQLAQDIARHGLHPHVRVRRST